MKKLLFLIASTFCLCAMDKPQLTKKPSQEDLEVAIHKIDDLADKVEKSRKTCCPLSRAQLTILSSVASSAITAAVTIATLYAHCDAKSGTNSTAPF